MDWKLQKSGAGVIRLDKLKEKYIMNLSFEVNIYI